MKPKAKQSNPQDPLDPNRLIHTFSIDAKEAETWFFREQDKILDLTFNCFSTTTCKHGGTKLSAPPAAKHSRYSPMPTAP